MGDKDKRPIDRIRGCGYVGDDCSPDDTGGAVAMFQIESRLCVVTASGVYSVQLADQTDPKRCRCIA